MIKKLNTKLFSIILILSFVIGTIGQANFTQASAYRKGKYIYYAYAIGSGTRGIMRYNTHSGKNKRMVSYKLNGEATNGFSDVAVAGNYIYATWDQFYGTDGNCNYIYRFSKNGKNKKKLAVGSLCMVLGNYIYYFEEKETFEWYNTKMTEPTGYLYKMKLNGKSKTKVVKLSEEDWYGSFEGKFVYADSETSEYVYTETGDKIKRELLENAEAYTYEVNKTNGDYPTQLYRKNKKTGQTNLVASFQEGIYEWEVCGDYVMLVVMTQNSLNTDCYCISTDGKIKKKLTSWFTS